MPTGYMVPLHEHDMSFEKFVWGMAKYFDTFSERVYQSAPDDLEKEESGVQSAKRELEKAEKELARVEKLSAKQFRDEYILDSVAESFRQEKYLKEEAALLDRLNRMLGKVQGWLPPTLEHEGLKKLMVEELERSIRVSSTPGEEPEKQTKEPSPEEVATLQSLRIQDLKDLVEHRRKRYQQQMTNASMKISWTKTLLASVPLPKD